jgi:hypothetical protein
MATEVHTIEKWDEMCRQADATNVPCILQIGSDACVKCPAVTDAINECDKAYLFTRAYSNAHNPDNELVDEFSISKLPSVVMYNPRYPDCIFKRQSVEPTQVTQEISNSCKPKDLTFDESF